MNAEQIKQAVREYAEREFPAGWDCATVIICAGKGHAAETLLVVRYPDVSPPSGSRPRISSD